MIMLFGNYVLFLLVCLFLCLNYSFASSFKISDLDIQVEIGKEVGINATSEISPESLQKVIVGAERGNKESLYFLGLLKMYGISLTKNTVVALENFRKAAVLGHLQAQTAYAVLLMTISNDEASTTNEAEYNQQISTAITWLRTASSNDEPNSHWLLSLLILNGKDRTSADAEINFSEAALLLQKAADRSIAQGEHYLGVMYEYGMGDMVQNFPKAMDYYRRATEKLHLDSMYHLALMYAYARGGEQDFSRALPLFESAARLGHLPSSYYVAVFRMNGYGCPIDYNQAFNWFELAMGANDEDISSRALSAMTELRHLLQKAEDVNNGIIDKYQKLTEEIH